MMRRESPNPSRGLPTYLKSSWTRLSREIARLALRPTDGLVRRLALAGIFSLIAALSAASPCLANVTVTLVDHAGAPIPAGFRWLLEEDNTYKPAPGVTTPGVLTQSISVIFTKSHAPVVASGEAAANPGVIPIADPSKRYFISVLPTGYSISGGPVAAGQTAVSIFVNPQPIPTAQVFVLVFHDHAPINSAPDLPAEAGLEGFRIRLFDELDEVTTDGFGNTLGTTYVDSNGDGTFDLDADGAPIVDVVGNGIFTDGRGEALIKNLPPAKYGIKAFPTDGQPWIQTTTIEGGPAIDAWVRASEPPYFREFGFIFWHTFTGFTLAETIPPSPQGTGVIIGQAVKAHTARAPFAPSLDPGEPVKDAWVGLNDLGNLDEQIYAQPAKPDGTFRIENVPPGTYVVSLWDFPLDQIIDYRTATIPATGGTTDLGQIPYFPWFGRQKGVVFYDSNENGRRDFGEAGIPDTVVQMRFRDGSIFQGTVSNFAGEYEMPEVFPSFFKFLIAEVDFGRFRATGLHAVVDAGGPVTDPPREEYTETNTDSGPLLLRAVMNYFGQTNIVDYGKKDYDLSNPLNNGGVSGVVEYATTRTEIDPRFAAADDWEPGIPRVHIKLFQVCARTPAGKPIPCDLDNDGVIGDPEGDFDTVGAGPADEGDVFASVDTDSFDDSPPTDCPDPDPIVGGAQHNQLIDCTEILSTWNAVRPGVFDGGWAIEHLPPGQYIVEADVPPGYEVAKEEDFNIINGDTYFPNGGRAATRTTRKRGADVEESGARPEILPPACVGPEHFLPEFLSIDGVTPNPANDPFDPTAHSPLCNRKEQTVRVGKNATSDFFLFTMVPKAGRLSGLVTDDLHAELDPTNVRHGDVIGVKWIPVTIRDWIGNILGKTYTDEWGGFDILVPSTWTIDATNPTGVSPNMVQVFLNDPGPDPLHTDPFYDPTYSQVDYNIQIWPGKVTYGDFPLLSNAAHKASKVPVHCEYPTGTPVIESVDTATGRGPYLGTGANRTVTINSRGAVPMGTTIIDLGFGTAAGQVTFNGTPQTIVSWTNATVVVTMAGGATGPGQLLVKRGDNGRVTPLGITLHVVGGAYNPTVRRVPSQYPTIQAAIDAAANNNLILVDSGAYAENVIAYKPLEIQGRGAGSTLIVGLGVVSPDQQQAFVARILNLATTHVIDTIPGQTVDPGDFRAAAFSAPAVFWLAKDGTHTAAKPAMLDGFTVRGGLHGSGIFVNAHTDFLRVSNNRFEGNEGAFGGGIRAGEPSVPGATAGTYASFDNQSLWIHHNQINFNAGVDGGGGISLFNGTDNYLVQDNWICGNFTVAYGGGINHFGLSNGGVIERNKILFNESFDEGGGIMIAGELGLLPAVGPAIALTPGSGSVTVRNNLIQGNLSGDDGGGVRLLTPNGQDVLLNPANKAAWYKIRIVNNLIQNNVASDTGGGISLFDAVNVEIDHNTVAHNDSTATAIDAFFNAVPGVGDSTPQPAGIGARPHSLTLQSAFAANLLQTYPDPKMRNNIIFGNHSYHWHGIPADLQGGLLLFDGVKDLGVVEALTPSFFHPDHCLLGSAYGAGTANILADPLLVSPYDNVLSGASFGLNLGTLIQVVYSPLVLSGDYHIRTTSRAKDAAVGIAGATDLGTDIDGDTRPTGGGPDIGADEFTGAGGPPPPCGPFPFRDDYPGQPLDACWAFTDPRGNSTSALTADGHLKITVPAGTDHDCWNGAANCARLTRTVPNIDAVYETRIDGVNITASAQDYGILLYQDACNYLRFTYWTNGAGVFVKSYRIIGCSGSQAFTTASPVTLGATNYLRVTRTGNIFKLEYSQNGATWTTAGTLTQAGFTVNEAGVYADNAGAKPLTIANADYFSAGPIGGHTLTITSGPAGTPATVASGGTASLNVTASDTLAHTVGYAWSALCAGLPSNGTFSNAAAPNPMWTAPANTTGALKTCTISVIVNDGAGGLTQIGSFIESVNFVGGHTLTINTGPTGTPNPVISGGTASLSVTATDTLAHIIGYTWSATCAGLPSTGTFSSTTVQNPTWTAPANATLIQQNCTIQVIVNDGAGGLTQTGVYSQGVSPAGAGGGCGTLPFLDNFPTGPLDACWSVVDPRANSTQTVTADGHLQVGLPAGAPNHDCWNATPNCTRVVRNVPNVDAVYETKIDGTNISAANQEYGIFLYQDSCNYIKNSYWTAGAGVFVRAYKVTGCVGATTPVITTAGAVALGATNYLRMTKTGTIYKLEYSQNGTTWTLAGSTTQAGFTLNQVGFYVNNAGGNPVTTGRADYFSATAAGGPAHTLTITTPAAGTPNPVASGGTASLSVTATDTLAHALGYTWSAVCTGLPSNGIFSSTTVRNPTWTAPANTTGAAKTCAMQVTVNDGAGGLTATGTFTETVNATHALTITTPAAGTPNPVASGGTANLSVTATDTLAHVLGYTWSAVCTGLPTNGTFSSTTIQAPAWTAPANTTGAAKTCAMQVIVNDGAGGLTATGTFTETVSAVAGACGTLPFLDNFTTGPLDACWSFVDPRANSTQTITADGHLRVALPAGAPDHDCWNAAANCTRVMRTVPNVNAVYETKIDGVNLTGANNDYGILLFQDSCNYIRFEYWSAGGGVYVKAYSIAGCSGSQALTTAAPVPLGAANYLRVTRTGTSYALAYSQNGTTYTTVGTMTRAGFTPAQVGFVLGDAIGNPATVGNADYFSGQ